MAVNAVPATKTVKIEHHNFAGPYQSNFLQIHHDLDELLGHINCSFFSTRGIAPTLLELKQHAQSLLVLIKHLTVATTSTPIDDPTSQIALAVHAVRDATVERNRENAARRQMNIDQGRLDPETPPDKLEVASIRALAFDFLADLTLPYKNSDPTHNIALTGLLNNLEDRGALDRGGRDHCPLHEGPVTIETAKRGARALPYAETWKLIKHADELLERLDHEFGAEGGLLGMLPLDNQGNDLSKATSLLGQHSILGEWISMTRKLIVRHKELETNLQEALEIVQGDAVVPRLILSQIPVDARQQTISTFADQDDIVISLSSDKLDDMRRMFKAKEDETFDPAIHAVGSGEGNQDIITMVMDTRYYRLREGNTIFIAPLNIQESQLRPGVVQVVKGEWRDRTSLWEQKNKLEMERLKQIVEVDYPRMKQEADSRKQALDALLQERSLYLLAGGKLPMDIAERNALKELIYGPEIKIERQKLKREREQLNADIDALKAQKAAYENDKRDYAAQTEIERDHLRNMLDNFTTTG